MLCSAAHAQVSPADVEQECVDQMALGICRVPLDRSMIAPGQTMLLSGVGRVSMAAMADYTDLYNPLVPQDPAMCHLALHYMTTAPGGDHDKIARALWTPVPKPDRAPSAVTLASAAIALAMGVAAATLFSIKRRKVA